MAPCWEGLLLSHYSGLCYNDFQLLPQTQSTSAALGSASIHCAVVVRTPISAVCVFVCFHSSQRIPPGSLFGVLFAFFVLIFLPSFPPFRTTFALALRHGRNDFWRPLSRTFSARFSVVSGRLAPPAPLGSDPRTETEGASAGRGRSGSSERSRIFSGVRRKSEDRCGMGKRAPKMEELFHFAGEALAARLISPKPLLYLSAWPSRSPWALRVCPITYYTTRPVGLRRARRQAPASAALFLGRQKMAAPYRNVCLRRSRRNRPTERTFPGKEPRTIDN